MFLLFSLFVGMMTNPSPKSRKKEKMTEKIVLRRFLHTILNWKADGHEMPPYVMGAIFGLYERAMKIK
mgnify:CR=1 FL=1